MQKPTMWKLRILSPAINEYAMGPPSDHWVAMTPASKNGHIDENHFRFTRMPKRIKKLRYCNALLSR